MAGPARRGVPGPDTPVTVRLEVTGAPHGTVRPVTDRGAPHTAAPLPVPDAGVVE